MDGILWDSTVDATLRYAVEVCHDPGDSKPEWEVDSFYDNEYEAVENAKALFSVYSGKSEVRARDLRAE